MRRHYPDRDYLAIMAFEAGEIMKEAFGSKMSVEWKDDHTPLTRSDIYINEMVISKLERDFPHIAVIGEEGQRHVDDTEYKVILDPIDGTIPFCTGIPVSTFCLAVIKDAAPIAAIIHDPFCGRTWFAEAGQGSFLNRAPIRLSNLPVPHPIVSVMWWEGSLGNLDVISKELTLRHIKWMNLGSVAICGGLIASNKLTASLFPGNKAWETAAMQLIVEEAGGVATDLHGCRLTYSDLSIDGHIMASNPDDHAELLSMVKLANS